MLNKLPQLFPIRRYRRLWWYYVWSLDIWRRNIY